MFTFRDYKSVSRALYQTLTMSEDEKSRIHRPLLHHIRQNTFAFWGQKFSNELNLTLNAKRESEGTSKTLNPPYLDEELFIQRYRGAKRRLMLFDYDGTLSPICKTPDEARPLPDMLAGLSRMVDDPRNLVYIISGRDQVCLDNWLGHIKGLGLRYP